MSSLSRYLAPTRAPRQNPGFVVEWRHGEGGPWLPLASAQTLEDVASELASPTIALVQGDLVRVLDPGGQVVGFSVQTDEHLVALPSGDDSALSALLYGEEAKAWQQTCGHDWEKAWEACPDATWMLCLASSVGVDQRLLVLAVCDCVEATLEYVPAEEPRPRRAVETARRWARREATNRETASAQEEAMEASGELARASAQDAARAAAAAARTARSAVGAWHVAWNAARSIANHALGDEAGAAWSPAWEATGEAACASLAVPVRQRIPLWRLALALVVKVPSRP